MVVNSMTLPAWCIAAREMGTKYKRVEMPRRTCTFAIANAPVAIFLVSGGKTARSTGFRADTNSAAVAT